MARLQVARAPNQEVGENICTRLPTSPLRRVAHESNPQTDEADHNLEVARFDVSVVAMVEVTNAGINLCPPALKRCGATVMTRNHETEAILR